MRSPALKHAVLPASAPVAATPSRASDRIGPMVPLVLLWMLFEFGRPYTPPGLPLILTAVLALYWLGTGAKQWARHNIWYFVIIADIAIGALSAPNTYAAAFSLRLMTILFLGICLPIQGTLTSVRRVRIVILGFIAICLYVGLWAATHSGFGPAASDGQDENYVATLMDMGIALAYFSIFAEKRLVMRLILGFSILVGIAAMALAGNPSRGGFLGLIAVAAYGLYRSPKKIAGLTVVAAGGLALMLVAGDTFWKEIDTTTDYESGTGDMRVEVWKAGLRMWQAHPVLGVGAGNFRWVIGDYQSAEQMEKFGRSLGGSIIAHSMHVELLAELGGLGYLAMMVLVWYTWTGLGRIRVPKPGPGEPPVREELRQLSCFADALRAAILSVLVTGAFLSLLWYSHLWVLLAMGSALPFVHRRLLLAQATPGATAQGPVLPRRERGGLGGWRVPSPAPGSSGRLPGRSA